MTIIKQNGSKALLMKECTDVESRDALVIICAVNYQYSNGLHLYDSHDSIKFTVSSLAPQQVKDNLVELAKKFYKTI